MKCKQQQQTLSESGNVYAGFTDVQNLSTVNALFESLLCNLCQDSTFFGGLKPFCNISRDSIEVTACGLCGLRKCFLFFLITENQTVFLGIWNWVPACLCLCLQRTECPHHLFLTTARRGHSASLGTWPLPTSRRTSQHCFWPAVYQNTGVE